MCTCERKKFEIKYDKDDDLSSSIKDVLTNEIGCLFRECNSHGMEDRCELDHPKYEIATCRFGEDYYALAITCPFLLSDFMREFAGVKCELKSIIYRIYYNENLIDLAFIPIKKDNIYTPLK